MENEDIKLETEQDVQQEIYKAEKELTVLKKELSAHLSINSINNLFVFDFGTENEISPKDFTGQELLNKIKIKEKEIRELEKILEDFEINRKFEKFQQGIEKTEKEIEEMVDEQD